MIEKIIQTPKEPEKSLGMKTSVQDPDHEPDKFSFEAGTVAVRHAVDVDLKDYKTKLKLLKKTYDVRRDEFAFYLRSICCCIVFS